MIPHPTLMIGGLHHSYPVYIGLGLLSNFDLIRSHVCSDQVLIVTNNTIASIYLDALKQVFCNYQCDVVILPDGEVHKNQHSLFAIHEALIQAHHHRDTTLMALGGGVIGDITGFAAATYQRGVNYVQLPTTLLSQVDAAIGGKTAINHLNAKNSIGSFYPPHAVIMDINTLATLPVREFRAGLAEVIKYGLLVGGEFLISLNTALQQSFAAESTSVLLDLITQCCQIKAEFVEADERDMGHRLLLNLGHTFAHALESNTGYQRWLHGEAVAIGLYCAALLSHRMHLLSLSQVDMVEKMLNQAQLPSRIPSDIDVYALYECMVLDKKISGGALRFVLIRAFGDCYVEKEIIQEDVIHVLIDARDS
jgi:3-dehydroquinate synthase